MSLLCSVSLRAFSLPSTASLWCCRYRSPPFFFFLCATRHATPEGGDLLRTWERSTTSLPQGCWYFKPRTSGPLPTHCAQLTACKGGIGLLIMAIVKPKNARGSTGALFGRLRVRIWPARLASTGERTPNEQPPPSPRVRVVCRGRGRGRAPRTARL